MEELVEYDPNLYKIKTIPDSKNPQSPLIYSGVDKAASFVMERLNSIPAIADAIDKFKASGAVAYVANLTKEQLQQLENGEIKLGDSKQYADAYSPNIYKPGERGTIGQLSLSKQQLPSDFMSSMVSFNMQKQLQHISQELIEINSKLDFIEQGQRNDRIALVYAARQQFIEASQIEDIEFQKYIYSQAITTANQARYQLHTSLNSDIESLLTLSKSAHNKNKVNDLSLKIRESLTYINISAIITAKAYAALGQQNAYLETLKSYKALLDETFYESTFKGSTYAQALYDNWDVEKYGNSIDWRTLPENISKEISSVVNDKDLIRINLNDIYGLPNDNGKLILEMDTNSHLNDNGNVVIKFEQEM